MALVHLCRGLIPFRFYLKLYFIRAQNYCPLQSPGRCPSSECYLFFLNSGHGSLLFPKTAARCVFIWPEAGLSGQDHRVYPSLKKPPWQPQGHALDPLLLHNNVNKANKTWTSSCSTTHTKKWGRFSEISEKNI